MGFVESRKASSFARLSRLALQLAWVLFSIVIPVAGFAQGITGTLAGTVKDAQGGIIPGASVIAINESQGTRTPPVITNETGDFVVPNLAAATYTVLIEMPQFKSTKVTGVEVTPGSRAAVGTVVLEVGGANDEVTVTSEAPLVQT